MEVETESVMLSAYVPKEEDLQIFNKYLYKCNLKIVWLLRSCLINQNRLKIKFAVCI